MCAVYRLNNSESFIAMLVFFLTSSKLTKFRSDQKRNFDPDHVKGHTRRTAINVSLKIKLIY